MDKIVGGLAIKKLQRNKATAATAKTTDERVTQKSLLLSQITEN